jgi:hypothetical protein
MALVNMAMSAEEAKEYASTCSTSNAPDAPKYAYGLQISLDEEALAKLGLTQAPAVGTRLRIVAECEVCSTSAYQTQGKETEQNVSLQITDMEIGEAQSGEGETQDIAAALYGDAS